MEKEDILLQKRLEELARRSYEQNMFTFTDFLALPELDFLYSMEPQLRYAGVALFGGMEETERKVVRFGKAEELGYEEEFPISCIEILPMHEKFSEELGHRDYLGALMNLGIERQNLGDICIVGKRAYVFCLDRIADFILENVNKIRHTNVKLRLSDGREAEASRTLETRTVLASSERIDSMIAKLYNLSRSTSLELFRTKKIYVNGRMCENNSYLPKKGDVISTRGYGKFVYEGIQYQTKKGKLSLELSVYV